MPVAAGPGIILQVAKLYVTSRNKLQTFLKIFFKKNPEPIIPLPLLATLSSSSQHYRVKTFSPDILNLCNKREWAYSKVLYSGETEHSYSYNWFRCSKIIRSPFLLLTVFSISTSFSISTYILLYYANLNGKSCM